MVLLCLANSLANPPKYTILLSKMPELRARKTSATKTASTAKTPSKRKAAADDDAPSKAPKKLKEDVQSKKSKRTASTTKSKGEQGNPDNEDENEASEGDDEAQALARIVDSDAESEVASPNEDMRGMELPKVSKDAAKFDKPNDSEPGVVYIGRIPRGFYEHQMREYFSQFGDINKIRMSRNKVTGQSKHFAFIEFAELDVAEIVAKTMDNYLLAGHILKVKMVPKSQIHEKLWVGANRRFKKIPWNKMAGNRLKKPLSESGWTGRISKEEKRRSDRAKKLLALGYKFEGPKIKTIDDVKEHTTALEAADDNAPKAIEAAPQPADADISEQAPAVKKPARGAKQTAARISKKVKKGKKTVS
ncbi:RNA-binding domain-containing protein [Xylariaceae sp. FL1651]|nr:RNA-binding domain-containing protein [Xylariaceae sp. FL1651]